MVIARRLARNGYLDAAVHQWALCSLRRSAWVCEFYDAKIAKDKSHRSAPRAVT